MDMMYVCFISFTRPATIGLLGPLVERDGLECVFSADMGPVEELPKLSLKSYLNGDVIWLAIVSSLVRIK